MYQTAFDYSIFLKQTLNIPCMSQWRNQLEGLFDNQLDKWLFFNLKIILQALLYIGFNHWLQWQDVGMLKAYLRFSEASQVPLDSEY
jgi:hypothetical protein